MAPAIPGLIDRGDLVAALDRAAAGKVTVISAPAGSGKTCLLRAWAHLPGRPHRIALVRVQRGQRDAQQFWLALLGAVRQATGARGGAEPPAAAPDFSAAAMAGRWVTWPGGAWTRRPHTWRSLRPTPRRRRRSAAAACGWRSHGWGTEPVIAPALMTLAGTMVLLGEFGEGERRLRRTERALHTDTSPDIRLLLHQTAGMLHAGRGRHHQALQEFSAAEHLASQLAGSQALASQVTGWLLATQARLGMTGEARAALAALDDEQASSGEIRNALAVICLADGDPAAALAAVHNVLDGTAPVLGYVTVVEAHLLAGLAHRQAGDQRAASQAAEQALALAESDRPILPFAMTGSAVQRARELRLLAARARP